MSPPEGWIHADKCTDDLSLALPGTPAQLSVSVRLMNESEGIWIVEPLWWQIAANQQLHWCHMSGAPGSGFCSQSVGRKSIQGTGGKKKKGQGETTWPCRCWRFLWQLCDFISRVKVPGEANPLYSCTCQKDFTCWPRDRECRLGSHVSFLSCCLLSPGPKQWLWETVGALMCLCWGHQWCHQLHCHVYMTHWVPDTHRRLLSCFSWLLTRGVMLACF